MLPLEPLLHTSNNTPVLLKEMVAALVNRYLQDIGDATHADLHNVLLAEMEPALLQQVMRHCRGNQSRAAALLGLNRATLHKKLLHYQIPFL